MSLALVLSLLASRSHRLRFARSATTAGMVCAFVFTGGQAWANTSALEDVSQLMQQGQLAKAAQQAQKHLKQNANDVQMRFLSGVIASEQRKYDQAIEIFTKLTQDYPHLPEPYNNLAVLYAAKGEERKAAQALEQAIRTNPSYATAHENLGDLYARMASDAYAKALQLEGGRPAAQPKLALIQQIFPSSASAAQVEPKKVVAAASAPVKEVVPPPPVVIAATPLQQPPAATIAAAAPIQSTEAKPAPEPPAPKANTAPAAEAVEKAVAAWAKAWAQQDMPAYYAAYSHNFKPQGSTLAAWKTERKDRIVGKPSITVEVRDLKVSVQDQQASASFRQYYASGGFKASTRKTLSLHNEGGKWLITREETGR